MANSETVCLENAMDFETAKGLALNAFFRVHPKELLPGWVNECATIGGHHQDSRKAWIVLLSVSPRVQLKANESWEIRHGRKVLAVFDPETGQKKIAIHRTGAEQVVIFQAVVDAVTSHVEIEIDSDISSMDGELYERIST